MNVRLMYIFGVLSFQNSSPHVQRYLGRLGGLLLRTGRIKDTGRMMEVFNTFVCLCCVGEMRPRGGYGTRAGKETEGL